MRNTTKPVFINAAHLEQLGPGRRSIQLSHLDNGGIKIGFGRHGDDLDICCV